MENLAPISPSLNSGPAGDQDIQQFDKGCGASKLKKDKREYSGAEARDRARPVPLPTQRGLSREEAAAYVGIGSTKFDEMVRDGRMPSPRRIDSRKLWDIRALDASFDRLPSDGDVSVNPWDN